MKYDIKEEQNWRRKITITIPEEDVSSKFDEVYKVLRREAKIPGFRPGKAPLNIIKSRYGKLAEKEVLETMVPDAYTDAIKESGVFPISEPEFSTITIEEGKPIEFSAEFDVKPEFGVEKYTGFTLKKEPATINEGDVDKAYNRIIDQHSSMKAKDEGAAAEEGDIVIVDMEKTSDPDNIIDDEKMTDFTFELNKEVTLPEFTENLIGTKPGDERQISVTYPEDYYDKSMAGKSLGFNVKVKEIKEIVRPELNEEFFKQFDGAKDEKELKEKIRADLLERRKQEIEGDIKDQAVKSVIAANDFELPKSLLDNYLDSVVEDVKQQYPDQEADEAEIREKYRATGIRFIRWNLLYHKIAEKENITVTKEDTDKWLQRFADRANMELEKAREFLAAQKKIQDIKETILEEKVLNYIIENSEIKEMD
ncbi:MAG TPA: trigger factor [candidate division Zixibacteria bacterium]|nr:trigger factor [candidate division Zixibacteria bacterium]